MLSTLKYYCSQKCKTILSHLFVAKRHFHRTLPLCGQCVVDTYVNAAGVISQCAMSSTCVLISTSSPPLGEMAHGVSLYWFSQSCLLLENGRCDDSDEVVILHSTELLATPKWQNVHERDFGHSFT